MHAEHTLGSRNFLAAIVHAVLGELAQPDVRERIAVRIAEQLEHQDLDALIELLLADLNGAPRTRGMADRTSKAGRRRLNT